MPSDNPAREKRLAAALRENLKRRKAAVRARAEKVAGGSDVADIDRKTGQPDETAKPN